MRRSWNNIGGFLVFAGPSTFAFLSITIVSFLAGLILTFTNWNGLSDDLSFVGLSNYAVAIADGQFWQSLGLTALYVVVVVVLANALAFALAYGLSGRIRFRGALRAGFFTPNLIGGVILGFIWYFIFSQGVVAVGAALGIDALATPWLASPTLAFWALVIATVWQVAGFLVVIYLAGLTTLPRDVLEAASIDGAGGWAWMRSVVLPLMRPTFTICVFLTIGRSFMTYDMNLTLTNGGPYGSTELVAMHVYQKAFVSQQFGTGQAEALVLFLIVAVISVLQVSVSRRREVDL
ncbi:carbohydrate ABC transporter permease [Actinoplanes subtropicus]|uniref:carbohydrate ABC transporter permease n=1 Tax=Actinoplanes subtropicus TaxID=543632 RepID=UPI0004C2F266|nr:sugar ABC transporter permease [Actinoplanes subtropicus]